MLGKGIVFTSLQNMNTPEQATDDGIHTVRKRRARFHCPRCCPASPRLRQVHQSIIGSSRKCNPPWISDACLPLLSSSLTDRMCVLQAVNALEGRIFNGNKIAARFFDREKFDHGVYVD